MNKKRETYERPRATAAAYFGCLGLLASVTAVVTAVAILVGKVLA